MKRLWFAFWHSVDGMKTAWRDEAAFRQEVLAALVLIPCAFYVAPDRISLVLMVGSVLLVLAVELLNSAIEASIDRHGGELHPLSKKAKDTASAAVLVALVIAGFTWAACLF